MRHHRVRSARPHAGWSTLIAAAPDAAVTDAARAHDRALARLIAKLDAPDSPAAPDAAYGALRAAFVDAGTRAVRALAPVPAWLQINVALDPQRDQWRRFMASPAAAAFEAWQAAAQVEYVWFVHKNGGLRWRFIGAQPAARGAIHELFGELERSGAIAGWNESHYDAETYQFGGPAGLDLTHRLFAGDTRAVLRYRTGDAAAVGGVSDDIFSLLLLDALLRRCVGDEWELWDVWCRMGTTGRLPSGPRAVDDGFGAAVAGARRQLVPWLRDPASAQASLSAMQRAVYADFARCADEVAGEASRLAEHGLLSCGLRELLPFWVIFHWNRFGIGVRRQRLLSLLMTHLLDPKAAAVLEP